MNPNQTKKTVCRFLACLCAVFVLACVSAPTTARADATPSTATDSSTPKLSDAKTSQAIEDCVNATNVKMGAYTTAAIVRNHQYWADSLAADQKNPSTYLRGDMRKKQCLASTLTFFRTIGNLIGGANTIKYMIMSLIQSLLNQVCTYIATAINNVLASVCIPLPGMNFSLSLPSMSSTTCNGLSLLNVLRIDSNTSGTPVPAIPTLDTKNWLAVPMKRGAATNSTGSTE